MSDPRPDPLLRPRGPLPGTVYWRRRLVLGAVLVVVLALLLRSCGSGADPVDGAGAPSALAPTPTPSPLAPTPSTTPASGAPTPSTSPTPSRSPTPAAVPSSAAPSGSPSPVVADCGPGDIAIGLEMTRNSYPVGGPVEIPVNVAARGETPCRVDVGAASLQVVLLSGGDRVWARQDCRASGSEVVTVTPGAPVAAGVSWDGDRSAPGCPGDGATARAGTYRAVVTVLGVSTPEVPFSLR